MKILIVEDNPQMRRLIRSFVEDLAEEIVECGDGEEAVAAYADHQFGGDDRVLMDLLMPRLGGLESTERLRAAFPEARIIIVTQYDDPHWRAAAQQAGACGYVLKGNLFDLGRMLQAGAGSPP
jgi:CheY-like chemotaxis protein